MARLAVTESITIYWGGTEYIRVNLMLSQTHLVLPSGPQSTEGRVRIDITGKIYFVWGLIQRHDFYSIH